jgi:hypothetical protein
MRGRTCLQILGALCLLTQLAACAVQSHPPTRPWDSPYRLPQGSAPGDRIEVRFEDGSVVSARLVDWTSRDLVIDHDGRRTIHPWHQVASVDEATLEAFHPDKPSKPDEPSPGKAVRRFFLTIGIVALIASAAG